MSKIIPLPTKGILTMLALGIGLTSTAQAVITLDIYQNEDSQTVFSYSGSLSTSELTGYSVGRSVLNHKSFDYKYTSGLSNLSFFTNFDSDASVTVNRIDLAIADINFSGTSLSQGTNLSYYYDPISIADGSETFGFTFYQYLVDLDGEYLQVYLPNINEYEEIIGDVGTEGYTDVSGTVIYDHSFADFGFTVGDSTVISHGTNGNSLIEINFTAIPEPSSITLLGISCFGLCLLRRRSKQA